MKYPHLVTAIGVILSCFCYALLRYWIIGPVHSAHIPAFLVNKAAAMAGLVLLVVAAWRRNDLKQTKFFSWFSTALIGTHILLSVVLLSPAYFGKFFRADGRFTALAELSLLAAVLATIFIFLQNFARRENGKRYSLGFVIFLLSALHVAFWGAPGWVTPHRWHGYLPPITLISFIVAGIGFFSQRMKRSI